jgi:glycosyltransferase involved in cell wall biosynthesis
MTLGDTLVSVVVPVHNGERFISRTLLSALAQNYDPIEVVVVDDGSTDRTAILLEAAAARDSRIRFFRMQKSGVAAARNFGTSRARGKFIAPLDADDLWHPEKIARQFNVMQASPEVGLVYCWTIYIDENDFVIPPVGAKAGSTARGRVIAELATTNICENGSSPLIRRSCIEAVGGYDTNLQLPGALDWKLYLALCDICEFAVIPEYLVGYRISTEGMSRDIAAMSQSIELVERWISEKWPSLPKEVGRRRTYNKNVYFAWLAFGNKQFAAGLRYLAVAYKARPRELLKVSGWKCIVRVLAQMAWLRQTVQRKPPVRFEEFQPATQDKM